MTWDTEIYDDVPGLIGVFCALERGSETIKIRLNAAVAGRRFFEYRLGQSEWRFGHGNLVDHISRLRSEGWRVVFP